LQQQEGGNATAASMVWTTLFVLAIGLHFSQMNKIAQSEEIPKK
jgi:hypothetical protein